MLVGLGLKHLLWQRAVASEPVEVPGKEVPGLALACSIIVLGMTEWPHDDILGRLLGVPESGDA